MSPVAELAFQTSIGVIVQFLIKLAIAHDVMEEVEISHDPSRRLAHTLNCGKLVDRRGVFEKLGLTHDSLSNERNVGVLAHCAFHRVRELLRDIDLLDSASVVRVEALITGIQFNLHVGELQDGEILNGFRAGGNATIFIKEVVLFALHTLFLFIVALAIFHWSSLHEADFQTYEVLNEVYWLESLVTRNAVHLVHCQRLVRRQVQCLAVGGVEQRHFSADSSIQNEILLAQLALFSIEVDAVQFRIRLQTQLVL